MPRLASRLIGRSEVAEGTLAFAFERPPGFGFIAGQYVTVTLPELPYNDAKGNTRTFSIASPPQEDGQLLIVTRMTGSALKRSLAEARLGAEVSLFGPAGTFTLEAAGEAPAIFIAGGIGITPFRSMILDALNRRSGRPITLVYSNRSPKDAAFHEEVAHLAETERRFRYLPTMTQAETALPAWRGETRFVDAALLRDCLGDLAASILYVAGPPGMVAAVTKAALEAGAASDQVIAEEFAGYAKPAAGAVAGAAPQQPAAMHVTTPVQHPEPARGVVVARAGDVPPGRMKAVEVGGRRIALCNVNGAFYAVADECPHWGGSLSEGDLVGKQIICPLHGAAFDVVTGAVLEPPADEALACYKVRVTGDEVTIEV